MPPIRFVVGLGNPGARYRSTRHNLGVRLLDRFRQTLSDPPAWKTWKDVLEICEVLGIGPGPIFLAKPLTYMNESGRGVSIFSRSHAIPPETILVCYDDLDLPLGQIRIRLSGASGGHRGMESVLSCLGVQTVCRLRLGIAPRSSEGRSSGNRDAVRFVLSRFSRDEEEGVERVLDAAAQAVHIVLSEGISRAMNRYNGSSAA